jgi:hypothetical protein
VTLHTTLWGGMTARAPAAAVDPFSVICHSGEDAGGIVGQTPTSPGPASSHTCDHCTLCGSASPPVAAPDFAPIQFLADRPPHVLEPLSTLTRSGIEVTLKGARGPPVFA